MITVNGDWFALETANTGYYLGVRGGLVENLHYGARVRVENSVPLREKTDIGSAATWCTGLRAHRFRWSICVWSCRRCKREIIVPRAFRS